MSRYSDLPCELLDIVPSPVLEEYRNKCEFTVGTGPNGEVGRVLSKLLYSIWLLSQQP